MLNTTQTSPASIDVLSASKGLGRYAARTRIGTGPHVIHAALNAARRQMPAVDHDAFVAGWQDERRLMRE